MSLRLLRGEAGDPRAEEEGEEEEGEEELVLFHQNISTRVEEEHRRERNP